MFSAQNASVESTDTNTYVVIGTQTWMKYNLKVTKYNDGTGIPKVTDNTAWAALSTSAYCWYDNDSATYHSPYGALYNAFSVRTGKLCPTGTHVPDTTEWTTLINYLGGSGVAGGHLKHAGTSYWTTPNTGADNSSGFTSLPSGIRSAANGVFYYIGTNNYIQSSIIFSGNNYWIGIAYNDDNTTRSAADPRLGMTVRCIKD
jgi:uncharacterized protein (TIGR02145 family)